MSPNTNPCHNTNIVSTIQAKPKQILSKSVTLATRPTSTQQFRQGRIRELALSCGILDLKNMQRDKLTSDPKYFETCLTSLYSYITYHTDKHKPFTTATLEQIHLSCHKYQRQHLKHKQRSENLTRLSLNHQDNIGSRFHYFCQDPRPIPDTEQGERVAHPRRTRKARIRKAVLPEPLGEPGQNRPNPIRKN